MIQALVWIVLSLGSSTCYQYQPFIPLNVAWHD